MQLEGRPLNLIRAFHNTTLKITVRGNAVSPARPGAGDASLGAAACTICCLWPARAVPWLEAGSRARPICESMLVLVRQHLNTTSARSCSNWQHQCISVVQMATVLWPSCTNGHRAVAQQMPIEGRERDRPSI